MYIESIQIAASTHIWVWLEDVLEWGVTGDSVGQRMSALGDPPWDLVYVGKEQSWKVWMNG